jgi:predicted dehydrogenase
MRIAIIGLGRMGRRHVKAAAKLGLGLVGVHDSSPAALRDAASELGLPPSSLFDDAASLLAKARPECVVVATTSPTHCAYACQAAEAGARFVLCEKPMAISIAECDRMIETCERHGTALAVNHPMRYMEQYTIPREIVYSDEIGGLSSVNVVAGDVGLAMNGTHFFEMFRFMTGEPPAEVTAWLTPQGAPNPRGVKYDDRAGQVRVTTASSRRLYLEAGRDQGHGIRIIYAGPHGQVAVDALAGVMTVSARRDENRHMPSTRYAMPWTERSTRVAPADATALSEAVLRDLLDGKKYPDGNDGRLAVATLVAAYLSDELGHKPVPVDLGKLPRERAFQWA